MLFFDYHLPEHLIAQEPVARRDDARLLVVHRGTGTFEHRIIRDLPAILAAGDRLILNDTKVLPARLIGSRAKTGGKWEALFLRTLPDGDWELMAQTRGTPQDADVFETDTGFSLTYRGRTDEGRWRMTPQGEGEAAELLAIHGHIPLPPYIRKGVAGETDVNRYQTVYAQSPGSVAAPTAGLHFTPELLRELELKSVAHSQVTLHVGLGTFAPIKAHDPTQHVMHEEWCDVNEATVREIQATKDRGGQIVAVGTTAARTLETAAQDGPLTPFRGATAIYIHPPYRFKVVDALLTNFHLPKTTLLLLVQSLTGSELLKAAYEEAIRQEYRFYSYGDAMLVL